MSTIGFFENDGFPSNQSQLDDRFSLSFASIRLRLNTRIMGNSLNLISGRKYIVVKSFVDFDDQVHPIGESWTYIETNFLPYDDGLTLHAIKDNL